MRLLQTFCESSHSTFSWMTAGLDDWREFEEWQTYSPASSDRMFRISIMVSPRLCTTRSSGRDWLLWLQLTDGVGLGIYQRNYYVLLKNTERNWLPWCRMGGKPLRRSFQCQIYIYTWRSEYDDTQAVDNQWRLAVAPSHHWNQFIILTNKTQ